jgi:hypothetical protein
MGRPKYGPMTEEHKKRISESMIRSHAEKKESGEGYTRNNITITLPNNPHRISRIVELGTILDNMFPKTKIRQIKEILASVRRILERGA